jgi:hypothetical protein
LEFRELAGMSLPTGSRFTMLHFNVFVSTGGRKLLRHILPAIGGLIPQQKLLFVGVRLWQQEFFYAGTRT